MNVKQIIIGYISWFKYHLNKKYRDKIKIEAKRRIEICEACEFFNKHARNCTICGCLMDVKTKMNFSLDEEGISIDGCSARKW